MIDLRLSAEQREIVDSAALLLREQCPVSRLRPRKAAVDVHALLVEWGWFGLGLPEAMGGAGLGITEEALLFMEAGRYLLSPSILATTLAAGFAGSSLRSELITGKKRAAMAIGTPGAAYCFDRADAELLVTIERRGVSIFPVNVFKGEAVAGLDESVALERGRLEPGQRLANEAPDRALLLIAAMLTGIAVTICELAVDYAKLREQFGQPIGAFQAVKHRCADMAVKAYAAEAQLLMAAVSASDDPANASFQIVSALRTATTAAKENGASAIQVYGGMGFTVECAAHLYLKRSHLLSQLAGAREAQAAWLLACAAPMEG